MDLAVTEAGSSDSRGDRADLCAHGDEGLLGGEASYLGPPLTPEKDDALQQATVANLRAALMSKNSLLSLKADVLADDSSLLLECLPRGAHSLSRKCPAAGRRGCSRGSARGSAWGGHRLWAGHRSVREVTGRACWWPEPEGSGRGLSG